MSRAAPPVDTPVPPHPSMPAWVGDTIAAVLVVAAAVLPFPDMYRATGWLPVVFAIAPAVALPFRRRFPVVVLAVVIALYGLAAVGGTLSPGIVLAVTIAMFAVASRSHRRVTVPAAVLAVIAILLLSLLATIGSVYDARIVQIAVTVAFAAAFGDAVKSRRQYIAAITERAERAERTRESEAQRRVAEERLRIARDLHDAVAHQISVISLNAGVASSFLETRPDRAQEALGTIRTAARSVLGEIGTLLELLRSDDDRGPSSSPQPGLEQVDELVHQFRDAGLAVSIRLEGDVSHSTGTTDRVAYQVLQEALTNAHKHGTGHRADAVIEVGAGQVRIEVANPVLPGSGAREAVSGGFGLIGLRERVASVRGAVETATRSGTYTLTVTLPLANESAR